MKLKSKIQLLFGGTVVALLVAVCMVSYMANNKIMDSMLDSSFGSSADLAANHISSQLADYMNIANVVGKESVIATGTDEERSTAIDAYAEEYGFTSGNILDTSGVSIKDGTDFSEREYFQKALKGETNISDITLSKYTNTYGFSIAAPVYDGEVIKGVVYFRADIDFMLNIIDKIQISDNSYAYLVDGNGYVIAHKDESLINTFNLGEEKNFKNLYQALQNGEIGNDSYDYQGETISCGFSPVENTNGWSIVIAAPESDFLGMAQSMLKQMVLVDILAIIISILVSVFLAGYISKSLEKVKKLLVQISVGNLSDKVQKSHSRDELGELQNTAAKLQDTLSQVIGQSNEILGQISRYDLTSMDMRKFPGEFNTLSESVNSIKSILNNLIVQVQEAASNVGVGSSEIADATNALSQGTVSQANSIQKVVMDIENVAGQTERNSENESVVQRKLQNLNDQIQNSDVQMTELRKVVQEIEEMSSDVQKIVGTIDSIAFQTNILALNASVEAARAGENGKGFAVVADEVGNLAAKCGESSKKTAELIESCIASISKAKICAESTFTSLSHIVADSAEISAAFSEISGATSEQAQMANSIKSEVANISDVVQTNTATAEETAASTQVLSEEAQNLSSLVQQFKVNKDF